MNRKLLFENGTYSGAASETHFFNELTFNLTNYSSLQTNNEYHSHTDAHLSFVLDGNYQESRKNAEFNRKPGEIVFCNAFETHKFQTRNSFRNLNIEISKSFLSTYTIHENQIENSIRVNSNAKINILKMLFELHQKDENIETTLLVLLLDIIKPDFEKPVTHTPSWIFSLEEIIHDKWNEKITLNELSHSIQIHPVTISKYFSKYFGCTFGEYLRRIKVDKSIDLLKNTSLSTTEIAYTCGFADQSHFIRTFKALNGFTPRQFQNY